MTNVHLVALPHSVKGFVRENEDDTYTIILNARHSHEQNLETFKHEIGHIENEDFEKRNVNEIEEG